jgi:hypothetical protein
MGGDGTLSRREKSWLGAQANALLRNALGSLGFDCVKKLMIPKRVRWDHSKDTTGLTVYMADYQSKRKSALVLIHCWIVADSRDLAVINEYGISIDVNDETIYVLDSAI